MHSSKQQRLRDLLPINAGMQSSLSFGWFQLYLRKLIISYRPEIRMQFPGLPNNTPNLQSWVWVTPLSLAWILAPKHQIVEHRQLLLVQNSKWKPAWSHLPSWNQKAEDRLATRQQQSGLQRLWLGVRTCGKHMDTGRLSWGLSRETL